jgi:hypothetical protein
VAQVKPSDKLGCPDGQEKNGNSFASHSLWCKLPQMLHNRPHIPFYYAIPTVVYRGGVIPSYLMALQHLLLKARLQVVSWLQLSQYNEETEVGH